MKIRKTHSFLLTPSNKDIFSKVNYEVTNPVHFRTCNQRDIIPEELNEKTGSYTPSVNIDGLADAEVRKPYATCQSTHILRVE